MGADAPELLSLLPPELDPVLANVAVPAEAAHGMSINRRPPLIDAARQLVQSSHAASLTKWGASSTCKVTPAMMKTSMRAAGGGVWRVSGVKLTHKMRNMLTATAACKEVTTYVRVNPFVRDCTADTTPSGSPLV